MRGADHPRSKESLARKKAAAEAAAAASSIERNEDGGSQDTEKGMDVDVAETEMSTTV